MPTIQNANLFLSATYRAWKAGKTLPLNLESKVFAQKRSLEEFSNLYDNESNGALKAIHERYPFQENEIVLALFGHSVVLSNQYLFISPVNNFCETVDRYAISDIASLATSGTALITQVVTLASGEAFEYPNLKYGISSDYLQKVRSCPPNCF